MHGIIHQEAPGMRAQGAELDLCPRRVGKRGTWEKKLAELLASGRFSRVYIGARLFTEQEDGTWRESR